MVNCTNYCFLVTTRDMVTFMATAKVTDTVMATSMATVTTTAVAKESSH